MQTPLLSGTVILLALLIAGCNTPDSPKSGPTTGTVTNLGQAPKFEYELSTGGCARFTVYRSNKENTEVLVVHGDLDKLGIREGVKELDVSSAPKGPSVTVDMYPRPQKHLHLCTDFTHPDSDTPTTWTAIRGKVRIERFPPEKKEGFGPHTFRVKVTVSDAVFRDADGREAKCPKPIVLDAVVGWFAG